MLERSLDLLYENYNAQFRHDILIFHNGDFTEQDQRDVAKGRPEIHFHTLIEGSLYWGLPYGLQKDDLVNWVQPRFSQGYRMMCRWYSVLIYDYLNRCGYEWYMRMDEDSFIYSKIEYDMFEYMEAHNKQYAYRMATYDHLEVWDGFAETVQQYIKNKKVTPTFLYDYCRPQNIDGMFTGCPQDHDYRGITYPPGTGWTGFGYYNNFLIGKLSFFLSPPVQDFLWYMDRTGGNFIYRWNDLVTQSVAVQLFLPKTQVHKFTDWTYEHATLQGSRLVWGGIAAGSKDINAKEHLDAFIKGSDYTSLGGVDQAHYLPRTNFMNHPRNVKIYDQIETDIVGPVWGGWCF